uniref:Glutamyl-tRNA(Gln) amidotransferase subunit A n=1 Tax=uncultured Armatimonadetes bacterium TaxID=157466 RepID=A0A6J4H219_9BACT|nr:Aspartyl-tRNA(Asn) amidotransferase subunit A @ Glutamyl-tRNA(Gln) amidotransferase subunit A [uncultured Armatimonadetes bacterium]
MDLHTLTAHELAEKIKSRDVSARAVTDAFLARIEAVDGDVKAFVTVTADRARETADAVDRRLAAGEEVGPLAGVPVALKDNLCTEGVETTCGSKILRGFVPPYNATVVDKLLGAGAVSLGKANMDEFAMGSSTENSALFTTRNPWDLSRVPGGSSGGSAAAVAAGEAPLALGSDTGGSIRQPAAFCGLVGVKPTYGRVSRYGLVAFASSLDQIGPFARNTRDAALLLSVIAGHDPCDSTSVPRPVPDYRAGLNGDVRGLRLGVPSQYFAEGIAPNVQAAVLQAVELLESLGAKVETVSLPYTEYVLPAYYILAPAEASSNLARYDGVRYGHRTTGARDHIGLFEKTRDEGFGAEVKQRIMIGTYALSHGYYDAFYLKAQQARTLIQRDFAACWQSGIDALVTPTAPSVAFGVGEKADDPLAMKLSDICTLSANMAGIPALSQCCGFSEDGLPIGLQLMGPAFSEETLLRIAHAYELATDWHTRRAPL